VTSISESYGRPRRNGGDRGMTVAEGAAAAWIRSLIAAGMSSEAIATVLRPLPESWSASLNWGSVADEIGSDPRPGVSGVAASIRRAMCVTLTRIS
jgi:hypothetical protein